MQVRDQRVSDQMYEGEQGSSQHWVGKEISRLWMTSAVRLVLNNSWASMGLWGGSERAIGYGGETGVKDQDGRDLPQ